MTKNLTVARARALAKALSGIDSGWTSHGCVRVRVDEEADRVVFEHVEYVKKPELGIGAVGFGRVLSSHSLSISASTEARVVAHWEGFCEAYGFGLSVGDRVKHPSGSATSGWRLARITKVSGRRVTVAGRFKNGNDYEVSVQKGALRFPGQDVDKRRKAAA